MLHAALNSGGRSRLDVRWWNERAYKSTRRASDTWKVPLQNDWKEKMKANRLLSKLAPRTIHALHVCVMSTDDGGEEDGVWEDVRAEQEKY